MTNKMLLDNMSRTNLVRLFVSLVQKGADSLTPAQSELADWVIDATNPNIESRGV